MQIIETIAEMRAVRRTLRQEGRTLGLVPTMGALHAGHLSLVRAARAACDAVAVSIFVNPTQFGPNEDFAKYPRTFEADCALLEAEGVQYVFAPPASEMYPAGLSAAAAGTLVRVQQISERLDGASRPGHFDGVALVVSKLFNIVAPERAFFGQKDAAQVAVLRRMVRELDFDLELLVCPIVREPDGLAMSSRNRYLTPEDRRRALVLSRALASVQALAAAGETRAASLLGAANAVLQEEPSMRIDYLAMVDPETLEAIDSSEKGALIAIAAYVGESPNVTRLIDNLRLMHG